MRIHQFALSYLHTASQRGVLAEELCLTCKIVLVPVVARSKAYACGRSSAETVGSNPTGGMDVCVLWVLCVVRYRSLRQVNHSSRGFLPGAVRRCVWTRNLVNEEALAHWGLSYQKQNKQTTVVLLSSSPSGLSKFKKRRSINGPQQAYHVTISIWQ